MLALLPLMLGLALPPDGFATKNINSLDGEVLELLGPGFVGAPRPGKLAYTCPDCAGQPILGIEFGRQVDGTEGRVRSGETKIEDLEKQCQARSPECRIEALDAGPAVGWVSSYAIGKDQGATAVLIRDGDLLTIRSVANDAAMARANLDKLLPLVREKIIGS
ncbi:hypothetical protein [Sphingomonas kyeonggiensis]|uniref:Uncharacterized protein n=1 Tax=Sphingomonas kyeonggiensis TaxID=1268553 RepID=A0A7W6NZC7_9SPHN|nr:hypothetical protein [Sphingomonas kyeonggiensis]MBB4100686.1 hypothetical protein [Sphingomonas kyeonggiensis]